MSGQPNSLLRLGYPEFDTGAFTDDDFVYYNNVTTEFQEFMEGPYSVILKYTGLRWLGKSKASFGCTTIMKKITFSYQMLSFAISFPTPTRLYDARRKVLLQ